MSKSTRARLLSKALIHTHNQLSNDYIYVAGLPFVAAENCSFPYTYNGQLYYSCAYNLSVSSCYSFCFLQNRTLALCIPPAGTIYFTMRKSVFSFRPNNYLEFNRLSRFLAVFETLYNEI